ncbi:hypothetical protein [Rhodococcus qingshengii]|uniref:hypothetical protein n=1 Tax=Rhodococcus qingshengii TaxID=334542 RepID=UPI001C21AE76|nr:hypothetical protein [Rhodococcus qingshengii]MCW0191177.1 hypothetical protein [Rhodococcus sp. (in: high G+C Gram-positive bacteria)]QXC46708.1 hypothetical protein KSE96_31985 [Rhodococcus qingshengii]
MAEQRFDTNVRIPKPALDRLNEIARHYGESRDHTGRRLLLTYIEQSEALSAADRLTHISTVMRHPLPDRTPTKQTVPLRRLRLRLPEGAATKARELAFRIPGQAQTRGHQDYQSRLLTDAVMTSIAVESRDLGWPPISDPVLRGVYPLIRQRAALGLWELAARATRTEAEKHLLDHAATCKEKREQAQARTGSAIEPTVVEKVAALLDKTLPTHSDQDACAQDTATPSLTAHTDREEAMWHHRARYLRIQTLASTILSSAYQHASPNVEQALYDQDGDLWDRLVEASLTPRSRARRKRSGEERPQRRSSGVAINYEFRGGGAVWRAKRAVALDGIAAWIAEPLRSTTPRHFVIDPPGWRLVMPDTWFPLLLARGPLPPRWKRRVADHHVLHFTVGDHEVLWPTVEDPDDPDGSAPVAGLQPILSVLMPDDPKRRRAKSQRADPRRAAEILLLELIPRSDDEVRPEHEGPKDFEPDAGSNAWFSSTDSPFADSYRVDDDFWSDPVPPEDKLTSVGTSDEPDECRAGDVPPLSYVFDRAGADREASNPPDTPAEEEGLNERSVSSGIDNYIAIVVRVPAQIAQRLGFIDAAHARRLIEQAKIDTDIRMQKVLRHTSSPERRKALEAVMDDPAEFACLARTAFETFYEVRPEWGWYVTALCDEIVAQTASDQLLWVTSYLIQSHTRELERSMEQAGTEAARQFAYLHEF